MRIFGKWHRELTMYEGVSVYDIKSDCGHDWYELMVELDDRPEKWVVGVNPDGGVSWCTDGSVNGIHAPVDDSLVIVTDEFDFAEHFTMTAWDGEKFFKKEPRVRTAEELEEELKRLMLEIQGLKAS